MTTLRLAHRGDWRRAPENTLAALAAAMAVPGCDGVEFDVRAAADGTPVLLHDATLARVQGVHEPVDALDPSRLADLGVPTLEEALTAVPRRAFIDIELKEDVGPGIVHVIAGGRGPDLSRAVVSSFDPGAIRRVHSLAPGWPCWLNAYELNAGVVQLALELGCAGVSVAWWVIDPESFALAHDAGLEVAAFTVRRRPTFDRLARLGVAAVCVEARALDGP
jgi:glycerophosphoryl diester phosphodiesterase